MSSSCRVLKTKGAIITSPYGTRVLGGSTSWHSGIDIVGTGNSTDDIIAHSDGTVVWVQHYNQNNASTAGTNLSYGNAVKIKHSNGYHTLYAHMSRVDVSEGQTVKKGQVIGHMGNTGHSYGAHLHFEVRKGSGYSTTVNPKPYLNDDFVLSSGTKAATTKNYLCKGDTGTAVREMQNMLIACGYSCGSCGADSSFGPSTVEAVKAFQKANGLTVDGSYGPATQAKLKAVYDAKKNQTAATKPVESKPSTVSTLNLTTHYMTKNGLYNANDLITVKGIILHSVACPVSKAETWIDRWDKATYADALVNGFIDDEKAMLAVPCMEVKGKAVRTYHVANGNTHAHYMGFEMCECANIHYTDGYGTWDKSNIDEVAAYAKKTYANAVALFAKLCEFHGLDPLGENVILSHSEAHAKGMASNHSDVEHIWKYIGLTMDQFRKDVKAAMGGATITVKPTTTTKPTVAKTKLAVDGSWGPACTKRSQQYFGSVQDGIISNQPAANKKYLVNASTATWQFKSSGYTGGSSLVKQIQLTLKKAGYYTGGIDGFMGQGTVKAFQKFLTAEKVYKNAVDGYMGAGTVSAWQTYLNAH